MTHQPLLLSPHATLFVGDALRVLGGLPDSSVDAVVTDPPYAIRRLTARQIAQPATPRPECLHRDCNPASACRSCTRAADVAKFQQTVMLGQQSQNWHAKETHSRGYADNDPRQFQTWCSLWLTEVLRVLKPGGHLIAFGGTRTWHRLASAVEDAGFEIRDSLAWLYSSGMPKSLNVQRALSKSEHHHTQTAWSGWGTALKPAFEPIVLARRPLSGTMVDNISTWHVGPLNLNSAASAMTAHDEPAAAKREATADEKWPTNVHLDADQGAAISGQRGQDAANYFWVSKPGRAERVDVDGVTHPTVKPLDLMQRLIRLVTPPGGTVLDPFAGSGTTMEACLLEGVRAIGIEHDPNYIPLIRARVDRRSAEHPDTPAPLNAPLHSPLHALAPSGSNAAHDATQHAPTLF